MAPWQKSLENPYQGMVFENVSFPTTDGLTLRGWFFPGEDPTAPAVLYAPATAKDQRQGLSLVAPLHQAGYQVLLFNYRGYGSSEGSPFNFSYGARESFDVDAAVHYLSETRGIRHIGAIGHSAGAVSLILSAARNPRLDAIVVAAPFTSLQDIWEHNRPAAFPTLLYNLSLRLFELRKGFSRQQVRPLDVIYRIAPRPIFFIHGTADRRITIEQGSSLFQAAGSPKQIIYLPGASHDQVRSPGLDSLISQIVLFFDASLRRPALSFVPVNP
jgi:dipeptidyl aminopeptidase/acylaminoacyl peptidase